MSILIAFPSREGIVREKLNLGVGDERIYWKTDVAAVRRMSWRQIGLCPFLPSLQPPLLRLLENDGKHQKTQKFPK